MNTPNHSDIAQRAHELWTENGSPHGRDAEFWLEAEKQLMAKSPQTRTAKAQGRGGANGNSASNDDRLVGEMASESAIENQMSPAPSDQEAIRAALQKKEARTAQVPHHTGPKSKPPETGKPVWPKPHSS